ncbi:triose-phosphate isomerase [Nereida ignava]|uniref:triose-phosphate isomerase n=1 Tax=Nereida ignava TaxID=282199 RepID=UPI003F6C0B4D
MKKLIIANWKMNGSLRLLDEIAAATQGQFFANAEAVVCTPAPYLHALGQHKSFTPKTGAQNCASTANGAHTGEISAAMLAEFGVSYCLIGHSERRQSQSETNAMIGGKLQQLKDHSIIPVLCIGETQAERDNATWCAVLGEQLAILANQNPTPIVIAYEPIWAIGTGRIPTPNDIDEALAFIRTCVTTMGYPAGYLRILYGGSANAENAARLLSLPSVDGLLVGGASLVPSQFAQIVANAADTNWRTMRA